MLIIDLFTYTIYRFSLTKIGNDERDSMRTALAIMTIYIAFFSLMLSCLIGLIYENRISQFILNMDVSFVFIVGFAALIVFGIRYYKYYNIEQTKEEIKMLSAIRYKIYKYIINFLYIATPILAFVFFRLYAYGHI